MSFGKQGGAELRNLVKAATPAKTSQSSGGLDAGFIALTLGVVAVSGGAAFAAPSVISWAGSFASSPVRPIPTVIAGLDRDAAKVALAKEAFPDKHGRAFMKSVAVNFPDDHDRLLDTLADTAMKGGERDDLVIAMNQWSGGFAISHLDVIGRTGAHGFNTALDIADEALDHIDQVANGCDLNALQAVASEPEKLLTATSYGGRLYQFGMKSNRTLVDLAAAGSNASPIDATLLPSDEQALQSLFLSMMMDEQVMSLMQTAMKGRGGASQAELAAKVDICALGRTAIGKLKTLPDDTKARVWALGANEAKKAMARGGVDALFKPAQLSMR